MYSQGSQLQPQRWSFLNMTRPLVAVSTSLLIAVLAVASEHAEIPLSRGLIDFNAGNYTQALVSFDEALRIEPGKGSALYYRGVTRGRLGDWDGSVADLRADRHLALNRLAAHPDHDRRIGGVKAAGDVRTRDDVEHRLVLTERPAAETLTDVRVEVHPLIQPQNWRSGPAGRRRRSGGRRSTRRPSAA